MLANISLKFALTRPAHERTLMHIYGINLFETDGSKSQSILSGSITVNVVPFPGIE
jgi:hypothetical protein